MPPTGSGPLNRNKRYRRQTPGPTGFSTHTATRLMMLIDTIRALIFPSATADAAPSAATPSGADAAPRDPVALAACVLLLEIAHADGEFSEVERTHLANILDRHFSLPADSGRALMDAAERERQQSVDHFSFTQQLKREFDHGQKMVLAEAMWGLVIADGEVSDHEHYLTRKISNLLDLEPGYLSAAKASAAKAVHARDISAPGADSSS